MNYKKPSAGFMATRSPAAQSHRKSPADLLQRARCASSLRSIAFAGVHSRLTRLRDFGPLLATAGFVALLVGGLFYALWDLTGLPTVYQSHQTGKCVRVEFIDKTQGDCSNLPDRYHHVWVE